MARGTSSTQSDKNNKIIDRLHNIIRAGGINNYVLRVDFIAILYLMRRFEEEIRSHRDDFIGEVFCKTKLNNKEVDNDLYRFSRLNELTDATKLQRFINDEVIPFYRELPDIVKYPPNQKPSVYETNFYKYIAEFFRDASVSKLKSGRLKEVISLVSDIESATILSDDFLGDAVESAFANSTSAERKQMGLFRTPKHIRDLMVEMTKPSIKDKIYDPAVGTGGFLISAKNYIFANLDLSDVSENDLQKFYFNGLGGMEQDMFLHRFAMMVALTNQVNPLNIQEGDSLGNFDFSRDRESYSLILTNPPFGGEKNQDHYSNLWAMNSSETTVLFLKLMHELLMLGGRCATVVSEGMNTWADATSIEMRRVLSEDNTLEAVISLPQGVFQNPKGGIGPKTSIYFFRKTKPQKNHKVFFYQITNDGFSIGTNRREIEGSQIPDLINQWELYRNERYSEIKSENCYLIPITKITNDPIYSFNISSYLSGISQNLVLDYKKQIEKINKDFQYQLRNITSASDGLATQLETYQEPLHQIAENVAGTASVFDSLDWQFKDNLKIIDQHVKQNIEKLESISIPANVMTSLAPISEYRDLNENILKRGNQYSLVPLANLVKQTKTKIKPFEEADREFVVLGVSNTDGVFVNERKLGRDINQPYYSVNKNDFCYNPYRINVGSIGLNKHEYRDQIISGAYNVFSCDESVVIPEFLNEIFNSSEFLEYVNDKANGAVRMNFKFDYLENFKIPLPPIEKQNEILKKTHRYKMVIKGVENVLDYHTFSFTPHKSVLKPIGDAVISTMNGWSPKCDGGNQKVLGLGAIQNGSINTLDNLKYTSEQKKNAEKYFININDFFYSRGNTKELVALAGIVYSLDDNIIFPDLMTRVVFDEKKILPEYAVILFNSELGREYFGNVPEGSSPSMVKVSQGYMANFKIPLMGDIEKQLEIIKNYKRTMHFLEEAADVKKSNLNLIKNEVSKVWKEKI